jgi:Uma2 family endonuclease
MRAVMWQIPPSILAWREQTDQSRFDEVWDGVLHMGPTPTSDHQDFEYQLEHRLRRLLAKCMGARVWHGFNVARPGLADWRQDYRVPDLIIALPSRVGRNRGTHFEGGPTVVVEIYSPQDESYDKLPFYFAIGVEEVWIFHCDTKVPEVFVRGARAFRRARANKQGWLVSKATGVMLRAAPRGKLLVRVCDDPTTAALLPEDPPVQPT